MNPIPLWLYALGQEMRFQAACAAMTGLLANHSWPNGIMKAAEEEGPVSFLIELSSSHADALLKELGV